ncbi:MAG: transporter substrate-binding domain-containing diguanylate cyclase [Cetobacterium sp.]
MNKFKIFGIFILTYICLLSNDLYIPKNKEEQEYLEKIQKQTLVLGKKTKYFAEYEIENESLNDIIDEMLSNYLGLNISIVKGDWEEIHSKFKNKEIDILNFLSYLEERSEYALFSNEIVAENLMVISENKKLTKLEDLENTVLYVTKDSIQERFLKKIINRNDLNTKYIPVEDIDSHKLYPYVISDINIIGEKNKLNLGKIPGSSIGVQKEHDQLLNIINNALEEKYSEKIDNWFKKRKEIIFKERLEVILNEDEKKYLKNLPTLKVAYRNIEKVSKYSILDDTYVGLAPRILNYLSQNMGIKIENISSAGLFEPKNYRAAVESEKIDIMLMSKISERESYFIFTKKITDIKIYKVKKIGISSSREKIGVVNNTLEHSIVKQFYPKNKIVTYLNEIKMIEGFRKEQVNTVASINIDTSSISRYDISILDTIPVNIALKKDRVILRDILNKVLEEFVDLEEFTRISDLNRKKNELKEKRLQDSKVSLIIGSSTILFLLVVLQMAKILHQRIKEKEYLKDTLTGLFNRRFYNEFCKRKDKENGVAILLDLNNFKILNDTHGHDYGDEVLIEVGKNLKKIFQKDYVFRIAGDEFHIFSTKDNDIRFKLVKLQRAFENSKILNDNNICFSLGYFYKKKSISMKEAFKFADKAMYSAKKKKDVWYEEFSSK